ncbi:MAG: hypothetical protein AB7I38_10815 [Dehalococcoidia bacterium]
MKRRPPSCSQVRLRLPAGRTRTSTSTGLPGRRDGTGRADGRAGYGASVSSEIRKGCVVIVDGSAGTVRLEAAES